MSKKPAMGHNPLDYSPLADAKFEFIPYTESGSKAQGSDSEKKKSAKKVVSYYLDENLVKEIKKQAKKKEDSYSRFVGKILKNALHS